MSRRTLTLIVLMVQLLVSSAGAGYPGFQTIPSPGGGRILYGSIHGQSSAQSAMGQMLRNIHDEYGETPTLGKELHDDSGELLATFFNVTAKNENNRRIAGLVAVSMPKDGPARAAVLSDDAKRFPQTLDGMLDRLQSVVGIAGIR